MIGISGKPYLNLDTQLSLDLLEPVSREAVFSLARLKRYSPGVILESENYLESGPRESLAQQHEWALEKYGASYAELGPEEKTIFLSFLFESNPLGVSLLLRRNRPDLGPREWFAQKHRADTCVDTSLAREFPLLMSFIREALPFEEVGRVVIFVAYPGMAGPVHNDYSERRAPDEFLWLNPMGTKRFFVFDERAQEKHYVKSRYASFNNSDFHGYDPSRQASFSIRVDGVFRESFRERIGTAC